VKIIGSTGKYQDVIINGNSKYPIISEGTGKLFQDIQKGILFLSAE
jgi:hypothetical protein